MSLPSVLELHANMVRDAGWTQWKRAVAETPGSEKGTATYIDVILGTIFTIDWQKAGRPLFGLDHSIAAMLAVTRSPGIDWKLLPFPLVVIEIPFEYAPMYEGCKQPCKVALGRAENTCVIGVFCDEFVGRWVLHDGGLDQEDCVAVSGRPDQTRWFAIALRIAFNALRYINEYPDRVESPRPRRDGSVGPNRTIRPPRDVTVDREFRLRAAQLVRSDSFSGARRALAHIVRGHWRNQPVGEGRKGRKLTWVRPHMRGDESLGRVVSRIERITAPKP